MIFKFSRITAYFVTIIYRENCCKNYSIFIIPPTIIVIHNMCTYTFFILMLKIKINLKFKYIFKLILKI